jgi:hypothetical protein
MAKTDKGSTEETARRRQRGRNWALLAALGGIAVLFYVLTFVTMGSKS